MKRRATCLLLLCTLLGCPADDAPVGGTTDGPSSDGTSRGEAPSAKATRGADLPELPNVLVAAGTFIMGSDGEKQGGQNTERPRADRLLQEQCYIDLYEVTNAAYAQFLSSPECKAHRFCNTEEPKDKDHTPWPPSPKERSWGAVADPFKGPGREQHPVVGIDWFDAYAFAAWMGRRLPTEPEWEKAARGTDGRKFPWGDGRLREGETFKANGHGSDEHKMTATVGSYPQGASPCGALDLAGNVWEWTSAPFYKYEGAPDDTEEEPSQFVIRGGGWNSASSFLMRGAMRVPQERSYRSSALGFRTVSSEHVAVKGSK